MNQADRTIARARKRFAHVVAMQGDALTTKAQARVERRANAARRAYLQELRSACDLDGEAFA